MGVDNSGFVKGKHNYTGGKHNYTAKKQRIITVGHP